MIVTATKSEMKTLDVPASVEVIDREKIENSGAGSAFEVLKNGIGLMSHSQSVNGTAMGTMTSRIVIRGVENGTLVLVDGVRMNMDGKYNLENIPAESIERIEVVRGGGSVLYGSEATGGVINIITKKNKKSSVKVEAGSYDRQRYTGNLSLGKFSATAQYQHKGKVSTFAESQNKIYDFLKGTQTSLLWRYDFNDAWSFTHSYARTYNHIQMYNPKTKVINDGSKYLNKDNTFLLRYNKDGWKAHLSYGIQEKGYDKDYPGMKGDPYRNSWRKGHNVDFDISKSITMGKNKLLVGGSYQREDMDAYAYNSKKPLDTNYKRNVYSIYASYDWYLGKSDNLIFNARQTWARDINSTQKALTTNTITRSSNPSVSKFTPEVQYIHKLSKDSRLYAKAGKSFRLPNITKIFGGTGVIQPKLDLKAEQGTHYEIGYKKDFNKGDFRVALFSYRIKDAIERESGSVITGDIKYTNADVRNTGVEVEARFKHDDHWSSTIGLACGNPQQRNLKSFEDNDWHSYSSKYQINASVNYQIGKFKSMLSVVYNGDRTANDKYRGELKPQCFTDLHLSYHPAANHVLDEYKMIPGAVANRETAVKANPDIILAVGLETSGSKMVEDILQDPALQKVKTVQNKQVFLLPIRYTSCNSQYLIQGIKKLVSIVYNIK